MEPATEPSTLPQSKTAPTASKADSFRWWAYASLIVAGLIAFWPSVGFDFVNWDDPAYVWHNDLIKSWSLTNLRGVATETVTRNYAPLTIGTLLIDHTLWGMNPCGYHATNVLLHLINGILVLLLVRQLTGNRFVAWVTAAMFLVHPVQIETVAWISSRKGLLSATFMLAALLARLRPEPQPKHDAWFIFWLAAALLSKALAVVVPAIVLCYDVFVRRAKFSDSLVRQFVPGLMAVLLLLQTMSSQHSVMGGVRSHLDLNLLQILAIDGVILWKYIAMLAWPTDLCVLYDPPTTGIVRQAVFAALGWAVVGFGVWRFRKQSSLLLFAALTFALLLLPVLNFFKITTLMNDRYLYLPCIAVFAAAASALHRLLSMKSDPVSQLVRPFVSGLKWSVAATAVAGYLVLTAQHLPVWRNSQSLWTHTMQHVPQLPVVRMQLALTHYDNGQQREAIRILQRALLECQPDKLDRERMQSAVKEWSAELNARTVANQLRTF